MSSGRLVASLSLTFGSFLFSGMIAVIMSLVNGAQAQITAVSPNLWLVVQPAILIVVLGGVALALWGITIYSWISAALPRGGVRS